MNEKKIDIDSDASPSEFLERAKDEGIELSDEQLEQVSSGSWDAKVQESHITMSFPCDNCEGLVIEASEEDVAQSFVDCPVCHTRYVLR